MNLLRYHLVCLNFLRNPGNLPTRRSWSRLVRSVLTGLAISLASQSHAAWQQAHGDSANTGFARVDTLPAGQPMAVVDVGPLAPSASAVTGPDGTVYIGNVDGELHAFHADGSSAWTRSIGPGYGGFYTPPVVGNDGSIYVVSTNAATVRDHRTGTITYRLNSWLHKFGTGGAWLHTTQFPLHYGVSGDTTAFPAMWRFGSDEAVMIPVSVTGPYGNDLRLLAFSSTTGQVWADQLITHTPQVITGGPDSNAVSACFQVGWILAELPCMIYAIATGDAFGFDPGPVPDPLQAARWPMPGVAVWQNPLGGVPWVMVSDGMQDTVGLTFDINYGFAEHFRASDAERSLSSPPTVLPDGHTVTSGDNGTLDFTGPNLTALASTVYLGPVTAAPTRMANGNLAVIGRWAESAYPDGSHQQTSAVMSLLTPVGHVISQTALNGASIASAAASCTHLYVATTNELATYDVKTMAPVARLPWTRGGEAAPIIGPAGHVYAIASNRLYVFAPPVHRPGYPRGSFGTACDSTAVLTSN